MDQIRRQKKRGKVEKRKNKFKRVITMVSRREWNKSRANKMGTIINMRGLVGLIKVSMKSRLGISLVSTL